MVDFRNTIHCVKNYEFFPSPWELVEMIGERMIKAMLDGGEVKVQTML